MFVIFFIIKIKKILMGISGNNKKKINKDSYIPALLISFTKINEFNEYFKSQKFGKLSYIFNSLINNNTLLDGHVFEFNNLKNKKFEKSKNITIKEVLNFILQELHNEINDNKINPYNKEVNTNFTNESESYKYFTEFYYKYNNSKIQDLFFGEEAKITRCSNCKITKYHFDVYKSLNFDIYPYKDIDIRDLIKDYGKQEVKNCVCNECNKKAEIISCNKIKKYSEIIILSFDNKKENKNKLIYYLNVDIGDELYILICFIIKENENNEDDDNYNVFYLENDKWFIYNVTEKKEKEIKDIKKLNKNPLVTFYQKWSTYNEILKNKYFNCLSSLMKSIQILSNLTKNHIVNENKYENYYIINKKWYNRLTKIFESEDIYQNDNLIFESINQIKNIPNLNMNESEEMPKLIIKRLKMLSDINLFMPEFEKNEKSGIIYPKDFILINEKELNTFLESFNININNINNYLYKVLFGENYVFIKSNLDNNVYYICYPLIILFYVDKILRFKEEKIFNREIKLYIKNRGGLEYYFEERKLNIDTNEIQPIIDKEQENIGDLINIITNKTMVNLNKYFFNNNLPNNTPNTP